MRTSHSPSMLPVCSNSSHSSSPLRCCTIAASSPLSGLCIAIYTFHRCFYLGISTPAWPPHSPLLSTTCICLFPIASYDPTHPLYPITKFLSSMLYRITLLLTATWNSVQYFSSLSSTLLGSHCSSRPLPSTPRPRSLHNYACIYTLRLPRHPTTLPAPIPLSSVAFLFTRAFHIH